MKYIDTSDRNSESTLASWFSRFPPKTVEELRFQTGYFTLSGLAALIPIIAHLRDCDLPLRCIIGSNDQLTSKADVAGLLSIAGVERSNARIGICTFRSGLFHPKVVHIKRTDSSQSAYVGSSNMTGSGVYGKNIEAGIILDTADGDPEEPLIGVSATIDRWFSSQRDGLHTLSRLEDVDLLATNGLLSTVHRPTMSRPAPIDKAAAPLHSLRSLFREPQQWRPRATQGAQPADKARETPLPNDVFVMECSRNRTGSRTFQADVGKDAWSRFLGGVPGERSDIVLNPVGHSGSLYPRHRQLVDVASHNYRIEIEFEGTYPTSDRPILMIRRRSARFFDYLLAIPDSAYFPIAKQVLAERQGESKTRGMRRAYLSHEELNRHWPSCPLILG